MKAGACNINLTLGLIHRLQFILKFLLGPEMLLFTRKISIMHFFINIIKTRINFFHI